MQERLDRHATTARLAEFSLGGGAEAAGAPGSGGDPCTPGSPGDYHMGLHIVAVFALLSVSLLGSLLPVALHIGKRDATTTAIKSVPGGGRSGRRDATTLPPHGSVLNGGPSVTRSSAVETTRQWIRPDKHWLCMCAGWARSSE